jgi:EF hand
VIRILTLIAAMSWSALALAESTIAMKPVTSFGYLDVDKDARVSPAEAKADWAVVQGFDAADTNKDGYLDKTEFAALNRS